eukprot:858433_1
MSTDSSECEICQCVIEPVDWDTNNVYQTASGFFHEQCPNILLIKVPQTSMFQFTEKILRERFTPYGTILIATILPPRDGNLHHSAIIKYDERESVLNALTALDNIISINILRHAALDKETLQRVTQALNARKFSKSVLLELRPQHIAYILAPRFRSRTGKPMFKKWMTLAASHKKAVVDFIYDGSTANNVNTLDPDAGYYDIPPHLAKLLLPSSKQERSDGDKVTESDTKKFGFIIARHYMDDIGMSFKADGANYIVPLMVIKICADYYKSHYGMRFYFATLKQLIEFDMEHKDRYTIPGLNLRAFVCIPDLIIASVAYDGVLVAKEENMHQFICVPRANREAVPVTVDVPWEYHTKATEYVYCDKHHGIIASNRIGLYRMKLQANHLYCPILILSTTAAIEAQGKTS